MVKRKSKGSLLGRSSSSSKDKTGLYLVSIVTIVAIVALFLMMKGDSQTSSEEVMVADEGSNFAGQAGWWADGIDDGKDVRKIEILSPNGCIMDEDNPTQCIDKCNPNQYCSVNRYFYNPDDDEDGTTFEEEYGFYSCSCVDYDFDIGVDTNIDIKDVSSKTGIYKEKNENKGLCNEEESSEYSLELQELVEVCLEEGYYSSTTNQWDYTPTYEECLEWAISQVNGASNEFCRGLCLWYLGNGDQDGYDQCMVTCER